MVGHVDPVADVAAVAVERHLQPVQQVGHEQRDDLLRELVRPVVVAAPGDAHVQPVGPGVGPGHQVAAGLGRRVRGVRLQRRVLGPGAGRDAAVHLVGGDLDHPRHVSVQAGLQQHLHAGHVGGDEIRGARDGPVHMGLGGEVEHRVMAGHDRAEQRLVADVTVHEAQPRMLRDRVQVGQVARVGQLVQDGDVSLLEARVAAGEHGPDIVRADEPGAAGNQDPHELICTLL